MQIDELRTLWMSDLQIPLVFVTEYLPTLSSDAVKVYLYATHVARSHLRMDQEELNSHLGMEEAAFRQALLELADRQLIRLISGGDRFAILDLKDMELNKRYMSRAGESPSEMIKRINDDKEKVDLLRQINTRFYHGMMGLKTIHLIDHCFHQYKFEPQVIYALFSEAQLKHLLSSFHYIEAIASAWHQAGITNFGELQEYSKQRDQLAQLAKKIGRKLKRNMDEPALEMVRRWVQDYAYDYAVISLALDKSVNIAQPNMNYFDAILKQWHEQGLKDKTDIQKFEEERKRMQSTPMHTGKNKAQARVKSAFGNFDQPEYSDEFLRSFYENLESEAKSPPEEKRPMETEDEYGQ